MREIHPKGVTEGYKRVRKGSLSPSRRRFELEFCVSHDMTILSRDTGEALMAKLIIPYLFTWQEVEARSDLERLRLVLDHMGDEGLMRKLEENRKWGRDDYPIRPVWNSYWPGLSISIGAWSHCGGTLRNGQLRDQCGFDPQRGSGRRRRPGCIRGF